MHVIYHNQVSGDSTPSADDFVSGVEQPALTDNHLNAVQRAWSGESVPVISGSAPLTYTFN
jgi:hypothetical protein